MKISPAYRKAFFFCILAVLTLTGIWAQKHRHPHRENIHVDPDKEWREEGLASVRKHVEGFVVFERLGEEHLGIWLQNLGHQKLKCLTPQGRYPRINHNGTCIYYLEGDSHLRELSLKTGKSRTLLDWPERIPAISVHPRTDLIYFMSSSALYVFNPTTTQVSRLEAGPKRIAAVDVDMNGDLVISTYEGRLHHMWKQHPIQIIQSDWTFVDVGCSAAISPDGTFFTDNDNRHRFIDVRSFETNEVVYTIQTQPSRFLVDNEAWSNLQDWLVLISENHGYRFVWLYQLGAESPLQVTFTRDADRPDIFITKVNASI